MRVQKTWDPGGGRRFFVPRAGGRRSAGSVVQGGARRNGHPMAFLLMRSRLPEEQKKNFAQAKASEQAERQATQTSAQMFCLLTKLRLKGF